MTALETRASHNAVRPSHRATLDAYAQDLGAGAVTAE
jgi:hypothetical protein